MSINIPKILAAFLLLASFSAAAQGQDADQGLVTPQDALDYSNRIVMDISRARFDEAWLKMKENSVIPSQRIDIFAKEYDSQYVRTIQYFGPSMGVELIKQDMAGKSMMRITYLVRYDLTGVTWFMYFYRKNDRWMLSEFNYDVNSSSVFSVSDSQSHAADQNLIWSVWMDDVERRLVALEGMNERLAALEKKGGQVQQLDMSKMNLDEAEMALLGSLEARLAEIENKSATAENRLGAVEQKVDSVSQTTDVSGSVDAEIDRIWRTIQILKKHHPYTEFPPGP